MFEYEDYPKMYKSVGLGKRPRESRLSEHYLFASNRVMREFAVMGKFLPSFVTIQFPSLSLDLMRFDVVISLVGDVISNDCYGGRNYRFEFRIPVEYPIRPLRVDCVTPVFHPNIGVEGAVGLKMLQRGSGLNSWVASDTIEGVIFRLYRLFFHPCNEDTFVINQDATNIYGYDPTEFKFVV